MHKGVDGEWTVGWINERTNKQTKLNSEGEIAMTAEWWFHARNARMINFFVWWKNIHPIPKGAISKEKLFLRKYCCTLHFRDIVLHLHSFILLSFTGLCSKGCNNVNEAFLTTNYSDSLIQPTSQLLWEDCNALCFGDLSHHCRLKQIRYGAHGTNSMTQWSSCPQYLH